MRDLQFRAWEYPTDAAALRAFEKLVNIGSEELGLWRGSNPEHAAFSVIVLGEEATLAEAERIAGSDKPVRLPIEMQEALYVRHIDAMLSRAHTADEDGMIQMRERYTERRFLHQDGTLHPFPEPQGQG